MAGNTLLTQDEIEALLDLVHATAAGDGAPAAKAPARVERRDFGRPEGLPGAPQERLWAESAVTASRVAEALAKWMRLDVRVELIAIEPLYFQSVQAGTAPHALVYPLKCGANGAHRGALTVDPVLALAAVDRILGGTGKHRAGARALTSVERTVADRVAATVAKAAADGFGELFPIDPAPAGPPLEPRRLAHLHEPKTPVLSVAFAVAGDVAETQLKLTLPLEPLREFAAGAAAAAPDALPDPLREVSVEVAVQLGGATIPLRDLIELEPGDVIRLDATPESAVTVDVEGRFVGSGRLGVVDRKLAISLESVPRRPTSAGKPQ